MAQTRRPRDYLVMVHFIQNQLEWPAGFLLPSVERLTNSLSYE